MPVTFATLPRSSAMERAGSRFGPRGTQGGAEVSYVKVRLGQTKADPRPGTDDDLLDAQVCEEVDGVLRPTLYGLMVFGRGPQRYRPVLSMFVHCARYTGLDRAARPISVGEAKGRLELKTRWTGRWGGSGVSAAGRSIAVSFARTFR